jgi:hypothetical protein
MKKLDWTRLLGFEQIAERRDTATTLHPDSPMAGKIGLKKGVKRG